MNKLISSLLLCLVLTCAAAAQKKSDREHERLIGPVKSVRVETARLVKKSGNWVEKSRDLQEVIDYGSKGEMTKKTIHADSPTIITIKYSYDKDGKRGEDAIVEGPTRSDWSSYRGYGETYNGGSRGDGDVREGRRARRVFKYDPSGNRIEETIYSSSSKATIYGGTAVEAIYNHNYDEKSQRRETIYRVLNQVIYRWVYDYDDKGNITEMSKYSEGGYLLIKESYAYEFDAAGNWIKRTTSEWKRQGSNPHFEPERVIYRTITYY
jgi:hypothetical protein